MSSHDTVIHGTLTPEGTLELDRKLALAPGRVQVIVKPLPTLPTDDSFWQRMNAIWNAQRLAGHVPRSIHEVELSTQDAHDEWQQRSISLEEQQGKPKQIRPAQGLSLMDVYLDVNCIIYFVEQNPHWWPIVTSKIADLRNAGHRLAVSDLSRAECLVGPLRSGDPNVLHSYQAFFSDPEVQVLAITGPACERAAAMRAQLGLKLPDALHLATAIEHGCTVFLTNDIQLKRCTEIIIELLTE